MKPAFTPLLLWWDARAPRERVLLLIMAAMAAVWLAVIAIWQPLQAARASLAVELDRHERAIAVLQSQPAIAAPVRATDDRPVNILVTETAATFDLTIRRLQPEGARLRVVLDEVPFDAVILWLEALQRDQGLQVTEVEMTRRPAPGIVNAVLAVER